MDKTVFAVIAGVFTAKESQLQIDNDLNELELLLKTLGIRVKGRITQKRQKYTARYLIGSGKTQKIKEIAECEGADTLVFDQSLTALQVKNLEKATCLHVYDRTAIILEIFSKHARSIQAKTQVEIAQLEYLLPRLTGAWTHFQRQSGGGVRSRGMGEKQIEIDRRRARERLVRLQERLHQIQVEKKIQRKARAGEFKVALVGYTNSGKTTLMQGLTRTLEKGKDELFATLDTNIKLLDPKTHPRVLLTDTVGFIRNLPHGLIESFKSTLDEVLFADLLLHVVDVSHDRYAEQMTTTKEVLQEVGASHIPTILVFNKFDRVRDGSFAKILHRAYPDCMIVSAQCAENMKELRSYVFNYFRSQLSTTELVVSKNQFDKMSSIYSSCLILASEFTDEKAIFQVQASEKVLSKIRGMLDSAEN